MSKARIQKSSHWTPPATSSSKSPSFEPPDVGIQRSSKSKKKGSRWKNPPVSQGIPNFLIREALRRQSQASEAKSQEETTEVQTKLTVGEVGDKYEQEADATAAKVVEQINSPVSEQAVQSKVEPVAKPTVMRRGGVGGGGVTPAIEQTIQGSRGSGQGLAESIKEPMEEAFGADFSRVKVHTDGNANQLNRSLHSRAFATGQDIFFKQGEYNPDNESGQELIAHELTHVVQQGGAGDKGVQAKEEKKEEETTVQKTQNARENELTEPLLKSSEPTRTKVQLVPDENPNPGGQNLIAQANSQVIRVPPGRSETPESSINYAAEQLGVILGSGCTPGSRGVLIQASENLNLDGTRTVQVMHGICGDSTENFEQQREYFEQSDQITSNNNPEYIAELDAVLNEYAKQHGGRWENTPLWEQMSQIYGGITQQNGAGDLSQAILYTLVERHLVSKAQLQERIRRRRNSRNDVNALNQTIVPSEQPVALNLEQDITYRDLFTGIITDIAQSERGNEKIRNIENKVNEIAARFQHTQGMPIDRDSIRRAVLVYWDSNAQQAVGGTPEQQPILQEYFENLPANDRDPNKGTQANIRERALNIFEAVTNHRNPATEAEQKFYRALRNSVMVSYYPEITNRLQDANIKGQIGQLNPQVQETLNAVSVLTPQERSGVEDLLSRMKNISRGPALFVAGAFYQWLRNNGESGRWVLEVVSLGTSTVSEDLEVLEESLPKSGPFEAGRTAGDLGATVTGILEIIAGGGAITGGGSLCITGIGCIAGAPAIAGGAAISVHGGSVVVEATGNLAEDLVDLVSGVFTISGGTGATSGSTPPPWRGTPRLEDGTNRWGWIHIEGRHITGTISGST